MPANRSSVCSPALTDRSRRPESAPARRRGCVHEQPALFSRGYAQGGIEGDGAEQRQRDDLALGQDAVEIVDPYRNQLDLRPKAAQPALVPIIGSDHRRVERRRAAGSTVQISTKSPWLE